MTTIPLPDFDTTVYFRNESNEVVATADLVQLDSVINEARKDLDLEKPNDRFAWVTKIAKEISLLLQRNITPGIAFFILREVHAKMNELKKTFENIQKLQNSMESMPSDFTQQSEDYTTKIYQDCPPSES